MICVYHAIDLDGWCSAAIVKSIHPDAKLIPYTYRQKFPDLSEGDPDDLVIVDVSFPMEHMKNLWMQGYDILWIDHHASAIRDYESTMKDEMDRDIGFRAVHDTNKAACELTWETFYPNEKMPEAVRLLGSYDCFRHQREGNEKDVLYFQYAARAKWFDPKTTAAALKLSKWDVNTMMKDGQAIYEFLTIDAIASYKTRTDMYFAGLKFAGINKARFNPINFDIKYVEDGYDGVASYYFDGTVWSFSLYSDKPEVDCSVICKTFGGGGHKGAAGFVTKNIEQHVK